MTGMAGQQFTQPGLLAGDVVDGRQHQLGNGERDLEHGVEKGFQGNEGFQSELQLGMRAKPKQNQPKVIGFLIDQDKIRPDVTIPAFFPITGQSMITQLRRQWLVVGKRFEHGHQVFFQRLAVCSLSFTLQVAPKLSGVVDITHARARCRNPLRRPRHESGNVCHQAWFA